MEASSAHPTLICYDGSEPSLAALTAAAPLLASHETVVLTVWQPLSARLVESGGFGVFALDQEGELDLAEREAAREAAEDGARQARERGVAATARVEEAGGPVWQRIVDVADELDAGLIVCATRGRGSITTALLGSTSRAVLQHAKRPVLVVPQKRDAD